jgi:ribosomal protein L36
MVATNPLPSTPHIAPIRVDRIRTDGGTQIRAIPKDQAVVDSYIEAMAGGAQFPPLVVFFDGDDYWLADGHHRHAAAVGLAEAGWGVAEFPCEVHEGSKRDAVLYAVGANDAHGHRRDQATKRRAVQTLLNDPEWSEWSDREIARYCKVDGKTVAGLRPRPPASAEIRSSGQRKARRNGKVYVINTANIGAAPAQESPPDEPPPDPPPAAEPEPPAAPAVPAVLLALKSDGNKLFETVDDIDRLFATLPPPVEAMRLWPRLEEAYDIDPARMREIGAWFTTFAKQWETTRVQTS